MNLSAQQLEAASFGGLRCSVVAVPGSGKTVTMTERIALLADDGVPPEAVLGLAFTRNAAGAMRERLAAAMGERASRVALSTIHGFCFSLLRRDGRSFEILEGRARVRLVGKLLAALRASEIPPGSVLAEISLAKNNLIDVGEYRLLHSGNPEKLRAARVYERYEAEKAGRMLLDFEDLLLEARKLLESAESGPKYRVYSHVLVDEYQDTTPAQVAVLKALTEGDGPGSCALWTCGDDFQSIFGFAGAGAGNIVNFERFFPGSTRFVLDVNYRSTPQILKVCQRLLDAAPRKIPKELRTDNEPGEEAVVLRCEDEYEEASAAACEIAELAARGDFEWRDFAVLYRSNFQSRVLEETFSRMRIPYRVESGLNFYNRYEIRCLLDYLRLIVRPDSEAGDEALKRIVNVPFRYVGGTFLKELETFASERETSMWAALREMPASAAHLRRAAGEMVSLLDPLMEKAADTSPAETISFLRDALDYDRFVAEEDALSPDDAKSESLDQLQTAAGRFEDSRSFLDHADRLATGSGNDPDGVRLSTVHRAKGSEFPVVFVVGLNEGLMPHKNGDPEEERRICFVAVSRAMKRLYLLSAGTRTGRAVEPSAFLKEMFPEND